MTRAAVRQAFRARFGKVPRFSRAPGRLNLIGEHTDYNEGFVLPVAIEMSTVVAFAPIPGASVIVRSSSFPEEERVARPDQPVEPRGDWSDYVVGVLQELRMRGIGVPGTALWIDGDLPLGAGLGSSASLEVATAGALLATAGRSLPPLEVALLCQRAENRFVGARCGLMDQLTSCLARAGHALLVDCRSHEVSYVRLPETVSIVILDSRVRHAVAGGEYNRRRAQCEAAVRALALHRPSVHSLRDADQELLTSERATLSETEYRRARHVVSENVRVLAFVEALRAGDLAELGPILAASHESLRSDFEVSCDEVDQLVDVARHEPWLVGARLSGAGFGGCTVNLVHAGREADFLRAMNEGRGRAVRGWVTRAAGPAEVD